MKMPEIIKFICLLNMGALVLGGGWGRREERGAGRGCVTLSKAVVKQW